MHVSHDLDVCSDCRQLIANGDIEDGTDTGERVAAAQVQIWGPLAWNMVLSGTEDEPRFMTSECDGCGETAHGDRWYASIIENGDSVIA
jgi:hypothetical protein